MSLDIRSKLALYRDNKQSKVSPPEKAGLDIHELLQGAVCQSEDGSFFLIQKEYPLNHVHGGYSLGNVTRIDLHSLRRLCSEIGENMQWTDFLFLDTETTGLSGGTGTVAFLVGIGYFTDHSFVLKQYFMRDFNEELPMLKSLNELLGGYKGLVTFNGKSFDWNLLYTRYTFNRIRPLIKDLVHLDLLYPARRLWKLKIGSCRLSSLEENILGETRIGDIPGALIPGIYFKYLEDRDASEIRKVIRHNEADILSLVSLLTKMSLLLENPLEESDGREELLGIGSIFEGVREYETGIRCYDSCVESDNTFVRESAAIRLAAIYKRNGDYKKAAEQWKWMIANSKIPKLYPVVELAKYYEHKEKNIPKALEMVEKAISISNKTGQSGGAPYMDLKKRVARLRRKSQTAVNYERTD